MKYQITVTLEIEAGNVQEAGILFDRRMRELEFDTDDVSIEEMGEK